MKKNACSHEDKAKLLLDEFCPLEDPLAEVPIYDAEINRHLQDNSPNPLNNSFSLSSNITQTVSVDIVNVSDNQTHLANESNAPVSHNMADSVNIIRPRILGLLLDVKTCCKSSYVMLNRGYELRKAIEIYIAGGPTVKQFQLINEEWNSLWEILALLKPLYIATIHFSKSEFPSLSTTLPIYVCLLKVFF